MRGHLIDLPHINGDDDTGGFSLLAASQVNIGLHRSLLRMQHVLGFHRIRYPSSGVFYDNVFDPAYKPTVNPVGSSGCVYSQAFVAGAVTCSADVLRAALPETPYSIVAGNEQGRLKHTLATTNGRYTPFLAVNNVTIPPVFTTRNTPPIMLAHHRAANLPDRVFNLEFVDDENGRFEGTATIFAQSDELRKIIERGDMTFQLEKSLDDGETWVVHAGGLARLKGDFEMVFTSAGLHYIAQIDLADMFARFGEVTKIDQPAYDEKTLKDSVNDVLFSASEPLLTSYPPEFDTLKMPKVKKGQNFRFSPQIGNHGTEILHDILMLARMQNVEYRLRHNWAASHWSIDQKPRDTSPGNTWTLTPFGEEVPGGVSYDLATRLVRVGAETKGGTWSVYPPEANILQSFGLSATDNNTADRVTGTPLVNKRSLRDPAHYDFLGRTVPACPMFAGLAEVKQIDTQTRRVYDAACGRRVVGVVPAWDYIDALAPLARVKYRVVNAAGERIDWDIRAPDNAAPLDAEGNRAELVGFWVKRRVTSLDYQGAGEQAPSVTYHLDTRWESDIK